ncbi:MAG: NAD(P)-dependent dehydrogenase (short-subunit alcohol dehydrogenase family) [Crocinitomix sp.]|jgi:NAD(P)-dependent dehydrogenase (short-subunit alcohol dehydrogenase family)
MKKIVICTGANGGIGRNYSKEMLQNDYHVILAVRNEKSGNLLVSQLKGEFPDGSMEVMIVDMGSLKSIDQFAKNVLAKHNRLDVLAHNAGVYFFDKERRTSADGIELNLAIHFIGPYALTAKLFPLLKSTLNSRVVSMSSTEHSGNPVDLNDVQMEKEFSKFGNMKAYARSKWATLAFTNELHNRITKAKLKIKAIGAHPGVSITGIQHSGNPNGFQKAVIWVIGKLFAGKPEDAAKPLAMASLIGESGEFYGPTGFKEFKGKPGKVSPDPETKKEQYGTALWNKAEELTGINFDLN